MTTRPLTAVDVKHHDEDAREVAAFRHAIDEYKRAIAVHGMSIYYRGYQVRTAEKSIVEMLRSTLIEHYGAEVQQRYELLLERGVDASAEMPEGFAPWRDKV